MLCGARGLRQLGPFRYSGPVSGVQFPRPVLRPGVYFFPAPFFAAPDLGASLCLFGGLNSGLAGAAVGLFGFAANSRINEAVCWGFSTFGECPAPSIICT